jgi:hypothetical protein
VHVDRIFFATDVTISIMRKDMTGLKIHANINVINEVIRIRIKYHTVLIVSSKERICLPLKIDYFRQPNPYSTLPFP